MARIYLLVLPSHFWPRFSIFSIGCGRAGNCHAKTEWSAQNETSYFQYSKLEPWTLGLSRHHTMATGGSRNGCGPVFLLNSPQLTKQKGDSRGSCTVRRREALIMECVLRVTKMQQPDGGEHQTHRCELEEQGSDLDFLCRQLGCCSQVHHREPAPAVSVQGV